MSDSDPTPLSERPLFYGLDHQPIAVKQAEQLFTTPGARQIDHTQIGPVVVSTVFLVVDHNLARGSGRAVLPVLYETASFWPDGSVEIEGRYYTREQAIEGHAQAVETVGARVAAGDVPEPSTTHGWLSPGGAEQ